MMMGEFSIFMKKRGFLLNVYEMYLSGCMDDYFNIKPLNKIVTPRPSSGVLSVKKHLCISFLTLPDSYLSSSTKYRSSSDNGTWGTDAISVFIIQGFANFGPKKMVLFVLLLLGYIIILGGNSIIIFVVKYNTKTI